MLELHDAFAGNFGTFHGFGEGLEGLIVLFVGGKVGIVIIIHGVIVAVPIMVVMIVVR